MYLQMIFQMIFHEAPGFIPILLPAAVFREFA
jgi:hypothetical protein